MEKIDKIKELCENRYIQFTNHALKRFEERNIDIDDDIVPGILSGEIIEIYPDDYPFESYLVLGITINKRYIHILCAIGNAELWIITAYFPKPQKWENDFKTRRNKKI